MERLTFFKREGEGLNENIKSDDTAQAMRIADVTFYGACRFDAKPIKCNKQQNMHTGHFYGNNDILLINLQWITAFLKALHWVKGVEVNIGKQASLLENENFPVEWDGWPKRWHCGFSDGVTLGGLVVCQCSKLCLEGKG